jgi:hypothetical protein
MKPTSANGVTGCLLPMFGERTWVFRVYHADGQFTDYDIHHSDLTVTIADEDAYFYDRDNGEPYLDHSPATLGKEEDDG